MESTTFGSQWQTIMPPRQRNARDILYVTRAFRYALGRNRRNESYVRYGRYAEGIRRYFRNERYGRYADGLERVIVMGRVPGAPQWPGLDP
jgi:hypothetical protein